MPYRVSIPDVCDKHGCSLAETALLVAQATKSKLADVKLPNAQNRQKDYWANDGTILAQVEWYPITSQKY